MSKSFICKACGKEVAKGAKCPNCGHDNRIPDYEIAELYEVKKETVRKRRYNLGIKQKGV